MAKVFSRVLFTLLPVMAIAHQTELSAAQPAEATPEAGLRPRWSILQQRLLDDDRLPVYTTDFVVADVDHDPGDPRRFHNFSGDLSGRFLSALAGLNVEAPHCPLPEIIDRILDQQRPDGRFGDDSLTFRADQLSGPHMALLWGNGRLLLGLLDCHRHQPDARLLPASRRLADFFLKLVPEVTPEVVQRLDGQGAQGVICFTQWTEPLVELYRATGETRYLDAAAAVYSSLPARGQQHTHGYLTTLRGVLELFAETRDTRHLDFVRTAIDDLLASPDYTVFGSVPEYFGGRGVRDEGCSTVDFTLLNFRLHELTGEARYLDLAENALFNALFYNQYATGDFGNHEINSRESRPGRMMAAWWCCTLHGALACRAVADRFALQRSGDTWRLNLYLDFDYSTDDFAATVRPAGTRGNTFAYSLTAGHTLSGGARLALRLPVWARDTSITRNGEPEVFTTDAGYAHLGAPLVAGDVLTIELAYAISLTDDRRVRRTLDQLTGATSAGVLHYGPYLMGVDQVTDSVFTAEPNGHFIDAASLAPVAVASTECSCPHHGSVPRSTFALRADYRPAGFPGRLTTHLRPVADLAFSGHPYTVLRFNLSTTPTPASPISDSLLDPEKSF